MSDNDRWVLPAGRAAADGWDTAVGEATPGWRHTGLRTVTLAAGESREVATGQDEVVVVPLTGPATLEVTDAAGAGHTAELAGRTSVFAGPTDVAYVGRGSTLVLGVPEGTAGASRVALASARAGKRSEPVPFRHVRADEVPVELRGAGQTSREVRNFATPQVLDADSIIACEVITPAGNWSSYPPHKHDEERPGEETALEEVYYFEVRAEGAPRAGDPGDGRDPVGYQRVYGTDDRPIDVLAEVRTGDVVLVPHGWHGPAMAPPGYDLYYLNVMAGPGDERAWLICDDPAHGWVRASWESQEVDPRLPLGGRGGQGGDRG